VARHAAPGRRPDRGAPRRGGGAPRGARRPQGAWRAPRLHGGPAPARFAPGAGPVRPQGPGRAEGQPGGAAGSQGCARDACLPAAAGNARTAWRPFRRRRAHLPGAGRRAPGRVQGRRRLPGGLRRAGWTS
jgi:hypothetical protein